MPKKIEFIATSKHVMEVRERPRPASEFVPDWWKDMPVYAGGANKLNLSPMPNVTAKRCFPLLDGITSGYICTLWADVLVSVDLRGKPTLQWATKEPVAEAWHEDQTAGFEFADDCYKRVFKYHHGWQIKTPPGYSSLITHPAGYPNLPFRTLTGFVDTDSLVTNANSPFMIKKGFEGIIEKGTPMFQVIPVKRDAWESEVSMQTEEDTYYQGEKLYTKIVSSYGRFIRQKKDYK